MKANKHKKLFEKPKVRKFRRILESIGDTQKVKLTL